MSKNVASSELIESIKFSACAFTLDSAEILSNALKTNLTLKNFTCNNCNLGLDCYEILINGLLIHPTLEKLDFASNKLNDKAGNMIKRIISRQSQRRNQVIWMYNLRNESPENNEYSKGLLHINLANIPDF